jgi:hypothetical protein
MTGGFEFLGFRFGAYWNKCYGFGTRVEVPKAKAADLRHRVKQLTRRNTTLVSLGEKLKEINPILRGWANYYRYCAYAGDVFTSLDWYIGDRIWHWLRCKRPKADETVFGNPSAAKAPLTVKYLSGCLRKRSSSPVVPNGFHNE